MQLVKHLTLIILAITTFSDLVSGEKQRKCKKNKKRLRSQQCSKYMNAQVEVRNLPRIDYSTEQFNGYIEMSDDMSQLKFDDLEKLHYVTDVSVIMTTPLNKDKEINTTDLNFNPENYIAFFNKLQKLLDNLQQISRDWYFNVRHHCMDNWKTIQDVLEENRQALIEWQVTLFNVIDTIYSDQEDYNISDDIMNLEVDRESPLILPQIMLETSMTIPPELNVRYLETEQHHMSKSKTLKRKKIARRDDNYLQDHDQIKTKKNCISAINLAEAMRIYWKESIITCLQKYLSDIKEEENTARYLERKVKRVTRNSLLSNFKGEDSIKQLQNEEEVKYLEKRWSREKKCLKNLLQELEEHCLNHEVQHVKITTGIEMCRKMGELYHQTMDEQIEKIQWCQNF